MLTFLETLAVFLVFMTATRPNHLEQYLFQKLGRRVYKVIWWRTDHFEISQKILSTQANHGDFERTVAENIKSTIFFSTTAKHTLIFCNSHSECDWMAGLLAGSYTIHQSQLKSNWNGRSCGRMVVCWVWSASQYWTVALTTPTFTMFFIWVCQEMLWITIKPLVGQLDLVVLKMLLSIRYSRGYPWV